MSAAVQVVEPDSVECPTCCGQGVLFERQFGRHVVDEYRESECPTCHGSGEVRAEEVRACEDCGSTYSVELGGCAHRNLCSECGPLCRDCSREAAEDLAFEQFRSLERIRMELTR